MPIEQTEHHEDRELLEPHTLDELCEHFNLGSLIENRPLTGGRMNQVTCLTTTKGRYVLKQYTERLQYKKEEHLARIVLEAQFLDFLKQKGFQCGSVYSPEVFVFEGKHSLIYDFVEGKPLEKNDTNLLRLAKQTALFHQLSSEYQVPKGLSTEETIDDDLIKSSLQAIGLAPEKIESLLGRMAQLNIEQSGLRAPDKRLPEFLIHGDLNPENILTAGEDLNFIDFESLNLTSPLREIARIIELWCLDKEKRIQMGKVNSFLAEYEKYRPLQKMERELLSFYFEFEMFARLVRRSITCLGIMDPNNGAFSYAKKTVKKIDLFQEDRAKFEEALNPDRGNEKK